MREEDGSPEKVQKAVDKLAQALADYGERYGPDETARMLGFIWEDVTDALMILGPPLPITDTSYIG